MIEPLALPFGKKRVIRAAIIDGTIWFVASDLFKVFKRETCRSFLSTFRDEDLRIEQLSTSTGAKRYTMVSVLGALTVATTLRADEPYVLDAWVRREVRNLTSADTNLAATIPMTLASNGDFLVHPRSNAAHFMESVAFRQARPLRVARYPRQNLDVLNDDDENAESDEAQASNAGFITRWIEKNFA